MSKLVIGISGIARSGKDTFCQLLIEELAKYNLRGKRFALADRLKAELRSFIIEQYSIDILNCTPEEKELVRDFLVFHGKMRRLASQGRHWTSQLKKQIEEDQDHDVAIITDVRYDIYPEDEVPWIKHEMRGPLVHISRYSLSYYKDVTCGITAMKWSESDIERGYTKQFIAPPNADEALNDPRIKAKADYLVEWNSGDIETHCRPEVKKFIEGYLKERTYL